MKGSLHFDLSFSSLLLKIAAQLVCITIFAFSVVAQDDEKVFRVDTKLAEFEVLVSDQNGKPVHGLKQDDFKIFEDGKQRRIDFFQPVVSPGNERPLVIVFAVDV
jgi:hypothetical protein